MPLLATVPDEPVDELRALADRLDTQADDLHVQARRLGAEAAALRRRAREAELPTPPLPSMGTHRADAVIRFLGTVDRASSTEIGEHLNLHITHVRRALEELCETGVVIRTGLKRGTRYHLAAEGEEAPATPPDLRYETVIRDAAAELGTFTKVEIQEHTGLSVSSIYRWLSTWVANGTLEVEKVGASNVYAYVKPAPGGSTHRRRVDPKPWEGAQRLTGTGQVRTRAKRSGSPLVNELLREVRAFPEIRVTTSAHGYQFRRDDQVIASCARTPGGTSLKGTRKQLRDAGINVNA